MQLRPYQKEDVERLKNMGSGLVYHDMRLGKTIITLMSNHEKMGYPCVIFAPKMALYVWEEEIKCVFPNAKTFIYTGKPKDREKILEGFLDAYYHWGQEAVPVFLITNYAHMGRVLEITEDKLLDVRFRGFIADEIHTAGLFNPKTATYKTAYRLTKNIPYKWLLTGTPYTKGCVDFFGPLSIVDRKKFDAYWHFVNKYCVVIEDMFGKNIERNPSNLTKFREMLAKYMVRREKKDVYIQVPPKQRQPIPVIMNSEQAKIYKELTEELIAEMPNGELIVTPGVLSLMIRQRQLLVCPQELGCKERGAAIDGIMEMLQAQQEAKEPAVIFTPFRKAVPWIEKAIKNDFGGDVKIFNIMGKMTAIELRDAWQEFQKADGFRICIVVIKSGAGFSLWKASYGYFLGCEYTVNLNEQAEDRLWHTEKKEPNQIYYMLHKDTVEDDIIKILNSKDYAGKLMLSDEAYLRATLKRKIK